MDEQQLMEEGVYSIYASAGATTVIHGCSLCMGKLSTVEEYMAYATKFDYMAPEIYKYLNFD